MIGAIYRRELLDHLMSVRFALSLVITVALMATNGIVFGGTVYEARRASYAGAMESSKGWIEQYAGSLAELAVRGPGVLHKKPSPLGFATLIWKLSA